MDLHKQMIQKLAGEVNTKKIPLKEIGENVVRRCTAAQKKCNAFINFDPRLPERGLNDLAQKIDQHKKLPLAGASFVLADAIVASETKTTCASRMLESYQSPVEATVSKRLKESGAFPAGKTNMDEFSLGATGENAFFGAIRNPWDTKYSAGSGAAAAVSCQAVNLALAPDIGGELRQSAAYCGVPALKPTYGRVSRKGLVYSAPSLEQIGIIAPHILDIAAVLEIIGGYDAEDPTSINMEVPLYTDQMQEKEDFAAIRVAVPEDWAGAPGLEDEIKEAFLAALNYLTKHNFHVQMVSLPNIFYSAVTATIIRAVETFSSLANYDGVRFGRRTEGSHLQEMYRKTRTEGFDRKLKQFLTFGALVSAGKFYNKIFLKAQKMRTLILKELGKCLQEYDLLLMPVVPFQAPLLDNNKGFLLPDPAGYYTAAANLAGFPALTFPLPVESARNRSASVQLLGKAWDETTLLKTALFLEKENPVRFPGV